MVSRRNFFVTTTMMLLLVFLFLFTEIAKETWNEYSKNEYEEIKPSSLGRKDTFVKQDGEYVAYLGSQETSNIANVVSQWAVYSKRRVLIYDSLQKIAEEDSLPQIILIDSAFLDYENDIELLYTFTENNVNVVFCNLPEVAMIKSKEELKNILGIKAVQADSEKITGYHLFDGFLLGGEVIYQAKTQEEEELQDLSLEVPWIITSIGTKTYMMALWENEIENEFLPTIIWRNFIGNSNVFVVNGNFMEDITGIGILDAMVYEMNTYEIHPVVNAQSISIVNYPSFTSENETVIKKYYSRSLEAVERDLVWPNLVEVASKNNRMITCLLAPQLDYEDEKQPDSQLLIYYLKMLKELHMEAGISTYRVSDTNLFQKLKKDKDFFNSNIPNFSFLSVYTEDLEELYEQMDGTLLQDARTILMDYDGTESLLSFSEEESVDLTLQRATVNAQSHTYSDNLRVRSIETALGYSNILFNMCTVVYPENEKDSWEKVYDKFASNVNTYFRKYEVFSDTTLSENDNRIRRFLALDFQEKRVNNKISLDIINLEDEAWFLLRTHGESIGSIEGGAYVEVEEECYLLQVTEPHLEINLKKSTPLYFSE